MTHYGLRISEYRACRASVHLSQWGSGGYPQPPEANVKWFSVVSPGPAGNFFSIATAGAGAAATPATVQRGSVEGVPQLRIPFRAEKKGKSTKAPGRADGTRSKGKGVVNAETAASALSSTQANTVRVADVLQSLAVQGTVQPSGKDPVQLGRWRSPRGVWWAWDA